MPNIFTVNEKTKIFTRYNTMYLCISIPASPAVELSQSEYVWLVKVHLIKAKIVLY